MIKIENINNTATFDDLKKSENDLLLLVYTIKNSIEDKDKIIIYDPNIIVEYEKLTYSMIEIYDNIDEEYNSIINENSYNILKNIDNEIIFIKYDNINLKYLKNCRGTKKPRIWYYYCGGW